ncbi:MetQ/NlpA family ABC transporter substrate-binding protein [Oceanobacillus bengalensis]|uniref:Lipoprotein n=1 Tax=Oceanobacillus bengalensis TaxID=1435466 RepID=A0A494YR39_9BACI|nr:MetQ/NlpA family ABC transporter substrate-binding protein [Oceanobacillus bengalensis]RKQ11481.1 methionine ABC transporter substrate-binding protein [Oceanobacillus bengalensis]
MKKLLAFISILFVCFLAACGGNNDAENGEEASTIKVGASSVPHAEILEEAVPLLEDEGITLEIEPYEDYVLPNDDLASGDLDANFFQHVPFLNQTIADTGYEIESIGEIHIEPMGVYSQNIKSVEEIAEGTEVILSNSIAEHGRILSLFEQQGLLTLDESVEKSAATIDDIVENPKNLTFSHDFAPEFLPELYHSEEEALVVINTNYAIGAELNPLEDAIFIEEEESEYYNVIAVQSEDVNNEALHKLVEVLISEDIQNFILENYEGAVIPVGGNS